MIFCTCTKLQKHSLSEYENIYRNAQTPLVESFQDSQKCLGNNKIKISLASLLIPLLVQILNILL